MTANLTIIHTNDLHNHLDDALASKLRSLKATAGPNCLLVDAGDAISSGNITYKPDGEKILQAMSDIGYDAMTVGNREFHFSQAGFRAKVCRAAFPVLCANVRARDTNTPLPVTPYTAITLSNGCRVAIFGITVPMITERMLVRKVSAYVFDDPLQCAKQLVPLLRTECDLLVCLSHIGIAKDRDLAASTPGIDLIIGGHTHAVLEAGEQVNETLIVQAGSWGRHFSVVSSELGEGKPQLTAKLVTM